MDVRAQVAADRVDGLVFLFDSNGESGQHRTTFLEQAMTAAGWPPRGLLKYIQAQRTAGTAAGVLRFSAVVPCRNADQRYSFAGDSLLRALEMASSATALTIQVKFSAPTEW